jgi:hypothetical protein
MTQTLDPLWQAVLDAPTPSLGKADTRKKAPPPAEKKRLEAALWKAATDGDLGTAKEAIEAGARLDMSKNLITPLFLAFSKNHGELARWLLGKGANIRVRDKDGATLMSLASRQNSVELAELLEEFGYPFEEAAFIHNSIYSVLRSRPLLLWWMDQNRTPVMPYRNHWKYEGDSLPEWAGEWAEKALSTLNTPLFSRISRYMRQHDPVLFESTGWVEHMTKVWSTLFARDAAGDLKKLLEEGWVPSPVWGRRGLWNPQTRKQQRNTEQSLFWLAARYGARGCMTLLLASDAIRMRAAEGLVEDRDLLVSDLPLDGGILEFIEAEFPGARVFEVLSEATGETLLHHYARTGRLTKPFLEWVVRAHPDVAWARSLSGHTVFDHLGDQGARWNTEFEKLRLKLTSPKASRKKADMEARPVRKRL